MTTEDLMKLADSYAMHKSDDDREGNYGALAPSTDARQALLDALEAQAREVAELKTELDGFKYSLVSAANAKLRTDVDTLRAELAAIRATQEPVAFLCDATRFKVFRCEGDENGRILGLPRELNGRWVALVAADDDCHLNAVASPDVGALVEADAIEAIDQVMEQAQVFASAWSLVGGVFDQGNAMEDADEAKAELSIMVASLARAAITQSQAARVPDASPKLGGV